MWTDQAFSDIIKQEKNDYQNYCFGYKVYINI